MTWILGYFLCVCMCVIVLWFCLYKHKTPTRSIGFEIFFFLLNVVITHNRLYQNLFIVMGRSQSIKLPYNAFPSNLT